MGSSSVLVLFISFLGYSSSIGYDPNYNFQNYFDTSKDNTYNQDSVGPSTQLPHYQNEPGNTANNNFK